MPKVPLWKQILKKNITDWEQLADFLQLSAEQRKSIIVRNQFPLNLPIRLAEKISKGTLNDPILRQFLPTLEEQKSKLGFISDPVRDVEFRKEPKLLHKYEGRVLLVCTSACAMHCRYCFRQNFDYAVQEKSFDKEIRTISEDPSIHEVILSGGDPLSLNNSVLNSLIASLSEIPHIKRVRFHTRFPIGIPERIDDGFIELLQKCRSQVWFVIHTNHARELDDQIFFRLHSLQKLGIPILNQFVLLKGVNDDAASLKNLCELLVDHGIFPYYMHQLDKVEGAAHFDVPEEKGKQLFSQLQACLPGYAIPKYVREIAGEASKTTL